jgi:4-hydroxy-tetrahydrodipicolinate synthase
MRPLLGSFTALATPFRQGALDEESYRALIRYQLENGTAGLVPVGTTGEAVTMSADERVRAIRIAVDAAKGKVPVIAGTGSNSTHDAIEQTARAREVGADAALVVTPYYNKPTQAGLFEHYKAVAKAHPGFPLVAYNVPGRTGVDLLPETCERLCELPEVVAVKEATASAARTIDIVERCGGRLTILSGDDFTVLPLIACGAKGVISVSSNLAPRLMSDLVQTALDGDLARSRELQVKLNPLHRLLFVEANPIPVKWGLHLMKLFGPELRLPLVPMTAPNAQKLEAELKTLGLL